MKIKSQKGSITIFVLIALLFYTAFLLLMYAANTNKFKTISEKSDILKGIYEKNTSEESINNIYNKKNTEQLIAGIEKISLPAEYQQVAYLESTGTQYIDTEVVPTINTKMGINLACLDSSSSAINWSGSVLSGNNGWFAVGSYGESENLVSLFCVNARAGVSGVPFDNNFHEYYVSNGLQKIDSITSNNTITSYNKTMLNIYLFKGKNDYGGAVTGLQKIKYCKIWEEDNLIRNLVPCYRKSDNKPGLYDIVNGKFYTNQGTGEFTAGPDVD